MSIEEIQYQCMERNVPFYCYRLPDTKEVVMGVQNSPLVSPFDGFAKNSNKKGFLIAPFAVSEKNPPLFIREDFCMTENSRSETLERWLHSVRFEAENSETPEYVQTHEEYLKEVSDLIQILRAGGELSKIVYSRVIAMENLSGGGLNMFQSLAGKYSDVFVYCFHIPGRAVWMGATPELFLQVQPSIVKTTALAGTRKITDKEAWGNKEYVEHEYVNRFIRSVLDRCSLTDRTESKVEQVNAGECAHLKTDFLIRADLSGSEIDRLIGMLHPTPAVCGYPQRDAMNEILRREQHDRQFYSGFLGPVSATAQISLFVNLRCMKAGKERIELFVGGGITKDSTPQDEWEETVLKARTVSVLV